ncbi:putative 2-hydroxyacid dehydrogenase [Aspergillus steynii IBT 23096]|uniref:Putative 2-hydroxyacid dehydrogenase n=1 Tax=Aspergillus steynii IBT 23096 TaxID=1392250 RepID=A0A2I2GH88_9EURO|nr:putative 2-hydroxyacid dehydrogenase [Aspergillus steynii IBT 23096]PLB52251.1 putative 2-hydroxyacid dehydrogenase [Aspergillus steynii IBT 23096]
MSPTRLLQKPRVVALGTPKYIPSSYLTEFAKSYNYSVLEAYTREATKTLLPLTIEQDGPIDALIIRMGTPPYEPFDADLLSSLAPDCKIITSASAGYNEFDVEWMASQGIWFCNTVDAVAEATADMALFLILAVLRNTTNAERSARLGSWRVPAGEGLVPGRDPSGLTLGIVGLGAIGKYLAKKAAVFNLRVIYHNRTQLSAKEEAAYGVRYCATLHELLAASDIVSVNCPLNASTTGLIGAAEFAAMKDGAFLVNTARGPIVDEQSLIEALESGKIARAGLDVFENEPRINPYFQSSDKVIIQPHLGGLTDMAFQRAEMECFENIRAFFEKGEPNSPVKMIHN